MEVKRRLSAIMAADVVGYSRLMGQDEEGALRRVRTLFQDIVRPLVAQHRGRVVKTMGDGFLGEFASVIQAFQCAVKLQLLAGERNADFGPNDQIQLRIGINVGDIIFERGDVFGEGVNIAARLEGLAKPGGICVSSRAYEDLRKLHLPFVDLGEQSLKNIAEPVRAYAIHPSNPEGAPAAEAAPSPAAPPPPRETATPVRRRWPIAAAVVGAALASGVSAAAWFRESRPEPTAFVAAKIEALPCSWLRVSEHSSVDGVEVFKLSGSSMTSPEALSRTLLQDARSRGVRVDRIVATDVAPLYPSQCAWLDKLKGYRYAGVPRFGLAAKPMPRGRTWAGVTLDPRQLGPAGAVYGVEPSGHVERIIGASELMRSPAATRNPDGSYTLNLMIDHVGWNGVVLMESATPPPEGLIERPLQTEAERARFEALAREGGWRFELAWFRVGG